MCMCISCECMCVGTSVYRCRYICTCVWRPEIDVRSLSYLLMAWCILNSTLAHVTSRLLVCSSHPLSVFWVLELQAGHHACHLHGSRGMNSDPQAHWFHSEYFSPWAISQLSLPQFLRQGFSLKLTSLATLTNQWAVGSHPSPPPQHWDYRWPPSHPDI